MAGRPSKPTQLLAIEGRSHRTKKEMEHRKKAEKSLYTGTTFRESPATKADPIAHREFLRLKKLYKKIEYVDGLDEQIINRYCMLISQEQALAKMMSRMREDIDLFEDPLDRIRIYESISGMTDKTMKTRDMLIKLEDRLFLNPTARIKSIPKNPSEEKKESAMAQFMNRRAGGHGT
jgi:phage terminase small subunit